MNLATADLKIDAVERTRTRVFLDQTLNLENDLGIGLCDSRAPSGADGAALVSGEDMLIIPMSSIVWPLTTLRHQPNKAGRS